MELLQINVQKYIKQYNWEIYTTIVYIHCNIFKRIYRMKKRGDSIHSIFKRIVHYRKHFKNIDYHYLVKT